MVKPVCSAGASFWTLPSALRSLVRSAIVIRTARYNYSQDASSSKLTIAGKNYPTDAWTNVPQSILSQYGRALHVEPNHPLSITRELIESRFHKFKNHNTLPGVVTVNQNFDSLGFAPDHPGRSRTDTYYISKGTLLRTHTSAHEVDVFRENASDGWTLSADVYRRDAVDRSHYPIFHQMEGALTWDRSKYASREACTAAIKESFDKLPKHDLVVEDPNPPFHPERNPLQEQYHFPAEAEIVAAHLKRSLEDMVVTIFSAADKALAAAGQDSESEKEPLKVRWVEAFFPHTSPSWEMEVWWRGDWLEVLGCGVIDQPLLIRANQADRIGWAFGIGLERIAMLLFGIPDIRLFWSKDSRFLRQFNEKEAIRRFQPFSKHPAAPRDVAFWLPATADEPIVAETPASTSSAPSSAGGQRNEASRTTEPVFHENDLMEIVRNIAGDGVEDVRLIDDFVHPKKKRRSLCYRIEYRSLERTMTTEEVNGMHERVCRELIEKFGVEISARRREGNDARPPNTGTDHDAWIEQQRKASTPAHDQDDAATTAPAPTEEAAKSNGDGRRTGRLSMRKLRDRKNGVVDVPKPPPIPSWFLKHNVFLEKDEVAQSKGREGKEVLRCVDAGSGHTLFTMPYYKPVEGRSFTTIRGKLIDISCLETKKDEVSGLPDKLREEVLIHQMQVLRAKKPHEIDQEALGELLISLPRETQEEILRREGIERGKGSKSEAPTVGSTELKTGGKEKKRPIKKTPNIGVSDGFFNQKFGGQSTEGADTPPRIGYNILKASTIESCPPFSWVMLEAETAARAALSMGQQAQHAASYASSRVDLALHCPDGDSHDQMDMFVRDLAQTIGVDVVRLDANDFEELAGEYVGSGQDSPGSLATLGYDVFNGYVGSSVREKPFMPFKSTEEDEDEFDMDEDEEELDEDEDAEEDRGSTPPSFRNISDLRKALSERRGQLGKMLSGVGIAHVHIGKSQLVNGGSSDGMPPGFVFGEGPKESAGFDDARLRALLDGLIDAGKQKRGDGSAVQATHSPDEKSKAVQLGLARAMASWLGINEQAGSSSIKMQSEQTASPLIPFPDETANRKTIIHVRDLKELQNSSRSGSGPDIIKALVQVVEKRRRRGESVMIIGTTAESAQTSFFMPRPSQQNEQSFRTITVPPLFSATAEELEKLGASMLPISTKTMTDDGAYRRILEMNLRHLQSMLRRLRPGQEVDLLSKSAQAQMSLRGTYVLGEKVLTLDQVQRLVLTAIGLAETHAKADTIQPAHLALAIHLTSNVDQVVQTWTSSDRMSKLPKSMQPGSKGKSGESDSKESGPSKADQVRSSCNQHEGKLLTGVADAKKIKTGFADVHAPTETIEALKTLTSLSLMRPEAFSYGVLANDRLPGLLLYGPPGTGKTLLAKAVARESKATVLEITGAQIYEKYVGEGEKMVRAVFSLAKKLSPCVVFIDEADAIFGSRSSAGNRNTHREIINQFLREWDGMDDRGVFVMVATNRPFDLDDAVLRRLPRRLLVDLPVAKDRESILGIHLKDEILDTESVNLEKLAERTPFYSGSDLKNLCVAAALACVREENDLRIADPQAKLPEKRTLTGKHFEKAVQEISASISEDMGSLTAIRKFDEQYGDRRGRQKKKSYGFAPAGAEGVVDESAVRVRQAESSVGGTPP
ncbi:phenylalanyl-tRNA synthetase alpha subunit, mitochondrial [Recurvomyces mirabilis]|uniref:Phenylalanine--tRNA ligase, mitochondrial n=1 Tax=Recurvomyces mirabilis TaxID=574656 RepID=A0AAE0WNX4_9PEZI|nr:phenylalanyl-tRNA synthetase alpha subunit, mitochondrial [Recurvomyces mirabilis]KAK5158277.1 hypothetical protein LTS14_003295 [Recurvomyces mirabilis]